NNSAPRRACQNAARFERIVRRIPSGSGTPSGVRGHWDVLSGGLRCATTAGYPLPSIRDGFRFWPVLCIPLKALSRPVPNCSPNERLSGLDQLRRREAVMFVEMLGHIGALAEFTLDAERP